MSEQEPKIVEVNGVKVESGSQAYWVEKGRQEDMVKIEEFKSKFKKFTKLYRRSFAHNLSDEEAVQNETARGAS